MQGRGGPAPFERVGGTMGDAWAWCAVGFWGGSPHHPPGLAGLRARLWDDWQEQIEAGCLLATLAALSDPAPHP